MASVVTDAYSPLLRLWVNEEAEYVFTPFGGTTAGNILDYFLGTPDIVTNVGEFYFLK